MRLYIHILRPEELSGALAGQVLDDIGELAATVVTLAGVAFSVLVGEHAACGFQYGLGGEVLAGDQLELAVLACHFVLDGVIDLGIDLGKGAGHAFVCVHYSSPLTRFERVGRSVMQAAAPEAPGRPAKGSGACCFSICASLATRRAWRPPAKSVFRK